MNLIRAKQVFNLKISLYKNYMDYLNMNKEALLPVVKELNKLLAET
ncbi:hypothetical protein [Flavivirga aquatica]|nr:hypothetical protein [Flavivirga aquatica]